PSITTIRRSWPWTRSSISTSGQYERASASARSSSSSVVTPTVMPVPCSPRAGLTTTSPTSARNSWSAASKVASRPAGTGRPARLPGPGVQHLDGDAPAQRLVGDDPGVGVEVVQPLLLADEQALVDGVLALDGEHRHPLEAELLVERDGRLVVVHDRQVEVGA